MISVLLAHPAAEVGREELVALDAVVEVIHQPADRRLASGPPVQLASRSLVLCRHFHCDQGTGSPIPSMFPSLSRNQAPRSPLPLLGYWPSISAMPSIVFSPGRSYSSNTTPRLRSSLTGSPRCHRPPSPSACGPRRLNRLTRTGRTRRWRRRSAGRPPSLRPARVRASRRRTRAPVRGAAPEVARRPFRSSGFVIPLFAPSSPPSSRAR